MSDLVNFLAASGVTFSGRLGRGGNVVKFLLFCILLVICWPVAILALFLYPIIWLLLLPFRLVGIVVTGVLAFIRALFLLPARILR